MQVLPVTAAGVPSMKMNATYDLRLRLVKYSAGGDAHVKLEVIRVTAK